MPSSSYVTSIRFSFVLCFYLDEQGMIAYTIFCIIVQILCSGILERLNGWLAAAAGGNDDNAEKNQPTQLQRVQLQIVS